MLAVPNEPLVQGSDGQGRPVTGSALSVALIAGLLVLLIPLPPLCLDTLLVANIALAVVMLLTAVQVRRPLQFSVFPTLLLVTTLARLVLNVASTRLILTNADIWGLDAAGGVIRAFSQSVAGERLLLGVVLFAILIIIQFVVITKGATRISEVAARFALDGLPGRQMAVDADLNAGLIDEAQAQSRRLEVAQQADFYASMDGASKFVRGDAIAGLIITAINVVGGLLIGVSELGMTLPEALGLFTRLTIGDGLVTQVPALLISLAAGMLVTRSGTETDLSSETTRQLFGHPRTLAITGGFLLLLVLTNLPMVPLILLGLLALSASWFLARNSNGEEGDVAPGASKANNPVGQEVNGRKLRTNPLADRPSATLPQPTTLQEELAPVEPWGLELGVGLLRLTDSSRGGDLLQRVQAVRHQVASELGIVLPKVRIRDNIHLDRHEYLVKIGGVSAARSSLNPVRLLAVDWGRAEGPLEGEHVADPVFGLPAVWVSQQDRTRAEALLYQVIDPSEVLSMHLTDVLRRHAAELLSREVTAQLLETARQHSSQLVEDLMSRGLSPGRLQCILQRLLSEGVPVRNLLLILEAIEAATLTQPGQPCHALLWAADALAEKVRARLAPVLCARYRDSNKRLWVATLEPQLEQLLQTRLQTDKLPSPSARDPWPTCSSDPFGGLIPAEAVQLCRAIAGEVDRLTAAGHPKVLLVSPTLRRSIRQLTAARLPDLAVLSSAEVSSDTRVEVLASVAADLFLKAAA